MRLMRQLIRGPAISTHYHADVLPVHGQDLQSLQHAVARFNAGWDTDLLLLKHDCHHYVHQLVNYLTDKPVRKRGWRALMPQ